MLIKRIRLTNLLSFGPDTEELELEPLNVLIGPNGSGKSNFIEAMGLLQATPRDLTAPIVASGGIYNWIWRGEPKAPSACIETVIDYPQADHPKARTLKYRLGFTEKGQRFELTDEWIGNESPIGTQNKPYFYYELQGTRAVLNYKDQEERQLQPEEFDPDQSILAQRKDPEHYPELTWLGQAFDRMRLYRDWSFGRQTPPRMPQDAALPNDFLRENGNNLGLVLDKLTRTPKTRQQIVEALRQLYEGVRDFRVHTEGGTVQVFMEEKDVTVTVPATRLSDGTLRYLSLLTILCHPNPPPLVCIEEPELGLHPDILPGLADLICDASERCQLIVTTHSDVLVDKLTETPESVVVCGKHDGKTEMQRLDKDELTHWLKRYSLGDLWTKGGLGGTRW